MGQEAYYFELIQKDNINTEQEGFHWKSHGRTAIIYYVENNSVVPIEAEMPGVDTYDVLVYGETQHIATRYYPNEKKHEEISLEDRFRIQGLLVKWLDNKGARHDIMIGQ